MIFTCYEYKKNIISGTYCWFNSQNYYANFLNKVNKKIQRILFLIEFLFFYSDDIIN